VLEVIALLVFAFIYILIIGRTKFKIPIWMCMLIGAVLMLITQTISLTDAFKSINGTITKKYRFKANYTNYLYQLFIPIIY